MRLNSPSISLELTIDCVGDDVRIGARGPRGENVPPRSLGIKRDALDEFKARVERAAAHGQALLAAVVAEAQTIQKAVLADERGKLFVALSREASPNPIFIRFMVQRDLQDVPWEALCNADEALGFWGSSSDVLPIRGVATTEPWTPSEVRGAVKVLAIAPTGSAGLGNLKQALDDRIATGEIEWLEPIEGAAAGKRMLFDQLIRRPIPHVIHFLGHGGIDKGLPVLRLADDDDEENWLPVELLAQQLKGSFSGTLRLIVLEACEGAKPSAFASAAEILAQKAGADAVVAHLWPVRADVARTCSTQFYRSLTRVGDVTAAMNQARREMLVAHDSSAQALSPVLYLRGPDGRIFDFEHRKIETPRAPVAVRDESPAIPAALARIVGAPFSLVLGDRWSANHEGLDVFRRKLHNTLLADGHDVASKISISALAQKFYSQFGDECLLAEFRRCFPITMEPPSILSLVARRLCPGVHTSLLRHPWLEACVAKEQPNRTIVVIQYDDRRVLVMKRDRGRRDDWKLLDNAPSHIDATTDIVVLRPYGGYTLSMPFTRPLLIEDDYQRRLPELWSPSIMPVDLGYSLQRALKQPPAWMLGLSMHTTHHRTLLQSLFQQGLPRNSVAMVEKSVHERPLWKQVGGKRAMQSDEDIIEMTAEALHKALGAMPAGREK